MIDFHFYINVEAVENGYVTDFDVTGKEDDFDKEHKFISCNKDELLESIARYLEAYIK